MATPLITTKNLYLQKDFSEQTETWLRLAYGVAEDEELLCAVWISPLFRQGFLITDEALRWSVAGNDGAKANGALLKDVNPVADFTITPAISNANVATASKAKTASEELSRLEITADGKTFTFFVQGLTEEKGKTLCDILKFGYTQREVPQTDLSAFVKSMPLLALRNFFDGDLHLLSRFADKILDIAKGSKEKSADDTQTKADATVTDAQVEIAGKTTDANTAGAQTQVPPDGEQAKQTASTETTQSATDAQTPSPADEVVAPQTSFGGMVRNVLLAVLDVCASLVFVLAVIIAIKPQLLPFAEDKTISDTFTYFEKIGDYILKLEVSKEISEGLAMWRNIFVTIGLILYIVFKLTVLLCSKNSGRKIVSALLLAMTLLACFLVTNKFLLFIAFCLLIYFAFQYSCELHTKAIIAKLIIICILGCSGYICCGILADKNALQSYQIIVENVALIKESLRLPINWW